MSKLIAIALALALGVTLIVLWAGGTDPPNLTEEQRRCEAEGGEFIALPNQGFRCVVQTP